MEASCSVGVGPRIRGRRFHRSWRDEMHRWGNVERREGVGSGEGGQVGVCEVRDKQFPQSLGAGL